MARDAHNWGFGADGMNGSVFPTTDPVDNEEVFDTFAKARTALADWFAYVGAGYYREATKTRKLTKAEVTRELRNLESPGEAF
jgi:hypothetical protein